MFPQIFGKYVLERELALGGMARVFLATLRGAGGFEKRLVVKQIRPELASDQSFIRRFVAEAKTTVELSHANIVPVYELGAEQGTYYIAMEFCSGVSLAELLRAGPASPSEGAYIGVEICRALDYAHRKAGVVHRDVTPRNVMIDAEGMVRLIDFGIAAPASAAENGGPAFGSPGHMPPEQLRAGPLTPAADVFAVAVLLIETWTGRPPFRRDSREASALALSEPRPLLRDADPLLAPLESLIASALAHSASERPQTAEELARPLREFLRPDDLGDIARRLGRRVSERLQALGSELANTAAPRGGASADGGTRPGHGAPAPFLSPPAPVPSGTQTFAVRDALLEWTAKIESISPLPSDELRAQSEIESGMTAPRPSSTSGPLLAGRTSRRALGVAIVACSALGLAMLGHRLSFVSAPSELVPAPHSPLAPAPHSRTLNGGERAAPASWNAPARSGGTPVTPERAATIVPTASIASVASAAAPAPAGRVPPLPTQAPARETVPRVGSGAPASPAPVGRLQLTAEPAAWVEVDATRVGRTPLMNHGATPGRHTLTFINPLLGERLEATVTVAPTSLTRVHADFTSANPRVIVR
jgi:eukaryotic-like serine/threonine-protein kinase